MKNLLIFFTLATILVLSSCASGYKNIEPQKLTYSAISNKNGVTLAYKYGLLNNRYFRKEKKKNLKLVAVKITNNSDKDLVFGENIKLAYESGNELYLHDDAFLFKNLKQSPASHLFYLLLSPINFYTYKTDSSGQQVQNSSTPIGLLLGPGIATGNIIVASNANAKLKKELVNYNMIGKTIKKGETVYGLVGFNSTSYDALKLKE